MRKMNQKGQAALLYTLISTALFGVIGLAADVGWMYFREQAAQSAAEAAAWGGALAALSSSPGGFTCGTSSVTCQAATSCPNPIPTTGGNNIYNACLYAKDNGFQVSSTSKQNVTIAANTTTPTTVSGIYPEYWVTATVTERVPQFFSAVLGNLNGLVSSRSTVGIEGKVPPQCIYVLDRTDADTLDASGGTVVSTTCAIQVNSNAAAAAQVSGSAIVTAASMNVVGTYTTSGTAYFSPTPTTGAPSITDPFINLPAPSYGSTCDQTNYTLGNANTATLSPGVYCGGIHITGSAVVSFNSGTYIMLGGGLTVDRGAVVSGSGVTFYLTGNSTYAYAGVNLVGGTSSTFSAPTSGTYKGVLFFQDRTISSPAASSVANGANAQLNGSIYLPTSTLSFMGGSSTNIPYTALIVYKLIFTGGAYMQYDATAAHTGIENRWAALIE